MLSPAPLYPAMEEARMTGGSQRGVKQLGPNDEFVVAILAGRTPQQAAHELVTGTKLSDPKVRKALIDGGEAAVAASTDPMIVLARRSIPSPAP